MLQSFPEELSCSSRTIQENIKSFARPPNHMQTLISKSVRAFVMYISVGTFQIRVYIQIL